MTASAGASPRVSLIVVTYDSADDVRAALPEAEAQLEDGDELIVLDNGSSDGTLAVVAEVAPGARVLTSARNTGFAGGANEAALSATGDLLVFLNPDAVPAPGFLHHIRAPMARREWDAWMGLLTQDGGRRVNTWGNVVHMVGLGWVGGVGEPVPPDLAPREVPYLSGGCLAVPAEVWRQHGGFAEDFFMYSEDLDLSLRIRLAGGRLGIEPAARAEHRYHFEKGGYKWRWMERNRVLTVARTYPGPLLALLAPALLLTELALVVIAFASGWGPQKLRAMGDVAVALPRHLRARRAIQSGRSIGSAEFAAWLTPELDSPLLGPVARARPLRAGLRAYWGLVRALLRRSG